MTTIPALTDSDLAEFEDRGVLRLERLFPADAVSRARDSVLRRLETIGLWAEGRWRLGDDLGGTPKLKVARDIGHRHPAVAALFETPAARAVVDRVLAGGPFDQTMHRRPQILFSLPDAEPAWSLPTGWHVDAPRLASGKRPGVQLFTFLDPVEPHGGGTLAVAGSHRLLNNGRNLKTKGIHRALHREPFFDRLFSGTAWRGGELPGGVSNGVALKVVELTGAPGDGWLMDLRVLHARSPNLADRPRMMVTHRFIRSDVTQEIAAAFGWA